ncbi:MAG: hypothetical protein IJ493_06355 [Clostridia bacterium]|nr:hypothetical protein [Clostridia bacterium]
MKRHIISSILIAALAAQAALAGCGSSSAISEDTANSGTEATTLTETADPLMDDLGEFDFEGYEFRVLSAAYDPNGTFTLFDTEENGEVLNDSVYIRNREIEERFHIVFKAEEAYWEDCNKILTNLVAAGEDAYDMIMLINRHAFSAALNGYLKPVSELTWLNPEKEYYIQDVNEQLTIAGKSFFLYSEESVYTFERAGVVAFNKQLAEEYNLGDYYQVVRDGEWTLDRFFGDAKIAARDLDGNDTMDSSDQYGIIGVADYLFASIYNGCDELTIDKDGNDIPYFAAQTSEKFSTVIDRILSELNGDQHIYVNGDSDVATANDMFSAGQSLFLGTVVGRLTAFRDMEDDFGMLPFPKYDENQDNYVTRVVDAWLHVVPITNPGPERTSVIMEALASGSARYVFPAYYEKAMTMKVLRDEESAEMLDLIRTTRVIDLGECPWFETVRRRYSSDLLYKQTVNFASLNESIRPQVEALIDEAVEAANNLK